MSAVPLGTVAPETSAEAIAFAKQSFRRPEVDELLKADTHFTDVYRKVQQGIIRNVKTKPGGFLASSGVVLPYYLNLSTNFMDPLVAPQIVELVATTLKRWKSNFAAGAAEGEKVIVVGMEVAGGMMVAQLAAKNDAELNGMYDFVYMRKTRKSTGTAQQLEATQEFTSRTPHSRVRHALWIDDVNSTGSSLCEGITILKEDYNIEVTNALYIVDRSVDRQNLELAKQKLSHQHFRDQKTNIHAIMDLAEIDPLVPRLFAVPAGEDVKCKVGDVLVFDQEENPSTGYKWHFELPAGDLVTVVQDAYVPPQVPKGTVGAPGSRQIRWKVNKAGPGTIRFEYSRSWENTPNNRVITFHAEANPNHL